MKLKDWLRQSGLTVPEFAAAMGETRSIAGKWVYGQRQPSLPKAVAIERFTDGAVKSSDLLLADQEVGDAGVAPHAPARAA